MIKRATISIEIHRDVYGQEYHDGMRFNPFLDKDGNICLSEQEINQITNPDYTHLKSLELKEPTEILKEFTKEEWIAFDLAETEKRLAELTIKADEIIKDPVKK